jgi:hypothetical protein
VRVSVFWEGQRQLLKITPFVDTRNTCSQRKSDIWTTSDDVTHSVLKKDPGVDSQRDNNNDDDDNNWILMFFVRSQIGGSVGSDTNLIFPLKNWQLAKSGHLVYVSISMTVLLRLDEHHLHSTCYIYVRGLWISEFVYVYFWLVQIQRKESPRRAATFCIFFSFSMIFTTFLVQFFVPCFLSTYSYMIYFE